MTVVSSAILSRGKSAEIFPRDHVQGVLRVRFEAEEYSKQGVRDFDSWEIVLESARVAVKETSPCGTGDFVTEPLEIVRKPAREMYLIWIPFFGPLLQET